MTHKLRTTESELSTCRPPIEKDKGGSGQEGVLSDVCHFGKALNKKGHPLSFWGFA